MKDTSFPRRLNIVRYKLSEFLPLLETILKEPQTGFGITLNLFP